MFKKATSLLGAAMLAALAFWMGSEHTGAVTVAAQTGTLTAQDYAELTQLINR